jgi:hypothetical protein
MFRQPPSDQKFQLEFDRHTLSHTSIETTTIVERASGNLNDAVKEAQVYLKENYYKDFHILSRPINARVKEVLDIINL